MPIFYLHREGECQAERSSQKLGGTFTNVSLNARAIFQSRLIDIRTLCVKYLENGKFIRELYFANVNKHKLMGSIQ